MKLIFITHYSGLYGSNQSLLNLIEGLKKYNVEVKIFIPSRGLIVKELENLNVEYRIVRMHTLWMEDSTLQSFIKTSVKSLINYFQIFRMSHLVKSYSPDALYSNSSVISIGYDVARKIHIPHIWHFREYGDLDFGLRYFYGKKVFLKQISHPDNHIIFVSQALRNHYKGFTEGVTIYNGIIKEDQIQNKLNTKNNEFVRFSFVGSIVPGKNVIEVIKAFELASLSHAVLNIYGDSHNKKYLAFVHSLVSQSLLKSQILLHGFEKNKDLIYNNTDCLIMPSRNEGFGRVTAEAMAKGLLVIGHNSPATNEIILDRQNGFLYNGDERELAKLMIDVFCNKNSYLEIRENAQQSVKNNFTVEHYSHNVYKLIEDVTKNKD